MVAKFVMEYDAIHEGLLDETMVTIPEVTVIVTVV